jgi:hypothetical protein
LLLQQAYTNELENKVHRLEEENDRLKKQKVLYLFNTLLSECHPHFASKGRFYPPLFVGGHTIEFSAFWHYSLLIGHSCCQLRRRRACSSYSLS